MGDPTELEWFQGAQAMARAFAEAEAPGRVVPDVLDSAIQLAGAERGFLVRIHAPSGDAPPEVRVEVARGFGGADLGADADAAISRSVVEEVLRRGEGIVTSREGDQELLRATTVMQRRVLAILCAPMRLRGETVGAIYLDNRFQPDAFAEEALGGLCLFADQVALALDAAELRARQARAEAQLEQARGELKARDALEGRRRRLKAIQRGARADPGDGGALRGESEAALRLQAAVERAARSSDPVTIVGETGSGKSTVAAEVVRLSESAAPLQRLLCGRVQPDALSLDPAHTWLLEELPELSSAAQAALLERLDRADAPAGRLLVTSRQPLADAVQAGTLRADLAYRLDVLRIDVPPLRARPDDVPLLLDHVSLRAGRRLELTPAALQVLADYAWPGNLHELDALTRRLLTLEKTITRADLPPELATSTAPPAEGTTLAAMERHMVVEALEACGGNKAQAARRLGIQRSTLYRLLDRYGLR